MQQDRVQTDVCIVPAANASGETAICTDWLLSLRLWGDIFGQLKCGFMLLNEQIRY